jgi:leader peptidase (prepilin peptidase)/N-methyltransferase
MGFDYIYYFLIFCGGTFIGSFLNLVSDRIINGEPILFGRSHCDFCKKPLGPKNLLPVISFIVQKGKCAFCGKKLSRFYPVSEALSGLAFVLATYYSGILTTLSLRDFWDFIFLAVILCLLIIIFLTDAKYYLIPDSVVYLAIGLTVVFIAGGYAMDLLSLHRKLSADPFGIYLLKAGFWDIQMRSALQSLGMTLASAAGIAFFFQLLVWITKERGMGSGDIKLGLLIGVFNGFPGNFVAIFLGFIFGSVYSLFLILYKRKTLKDTVPFGPFLIIGSVVALLYSTNILNWYINLF